MAHSDDLGLRNELSVTVSPLGGAPRTAFDRLREIGFRFVQLSAAQEGLRPRDLDRSARRDLLAALRRREMSVSGIDLWIPAGHLLDPARCDQALDAVRDAVGLAADLNRCAVCLALPAQLDQALREMVASLGEKHGVVIADHAVPPSEHASIRVGIDPAAWLAAGEDVPGAIPGLLPRLASARLCDLLTSGARGPVGDPHEGRLDLTAYRVALSLMELPSPIVIDARQWADPWRGVEQSRSAWESAALV